ncbi:MAG: hypothetical protein ACYYK0_05725 [Candidatus Eutrophobiaceae bacterium]
MNDNEKYRISVHKFVNESLKIVADEPLAKNPRRKTLRKCLDKFIEENFASVEKEHPS